MLYKVFYNRILKFFQSQIRKDKMKKIAIVLITIIRKFKGYCEISIQNIRHIGKRPIVIVFD